jgi:hypothetical protein
VENLEVKIRALDDFSHVFNKLGDAGRTIGHGLAMSAAAATAGMVALGAAGAYCVKEFMAAEKVMAQTEAVIKSTGGAANVSAEHVNDMAASLRDMSGVEDEAIASAANLLLTFTNIKNTDTAKTFDQATLAALDMSVALGTDMTDAAMKVGKALQDPVTGVTALRRVGVMLTDEQEASIKAFMDVNDVAGAQNIILQELQKEFGGSAEAAGQTLGGQLDILKSKFGDVAEEIGGKLAPTLSSLGDTLLKGIGSFDTDILTGAFDSIGGILEAVIPLIEPFVETLGTMAAAIGPVFEAIAEAIAPIVADILPRFGEAFAQICADLVSSGLIEAIGELAGIFMDFLMDVIEPMVPMLEVAFSALADLLNGIMPLIQAATDLVSGFVSGIGEIFGFNSDLAEFKESMGDLEKAWDGASRSVREYALEQLKAFRETSFVQGNTELVAQIDAEIAKLSNSLDTSAQDMGKWEKTWEKAMADAGTVTETELNAMGKEMAKQAHTMSEEGGKVPQHIVYRPPEVPQRHDGKHEGGLARCAGNL